MFRNSVLMFHILMQVFENMDADLRIDRDGGKVYFSNKKLYNTLGFQFSLSKKKKVLKAYRNGKKLNNKNATNILYTLNGFTVAYFDFKEQKIYCKCTRKSWNYSLEILTKLEQEAKQIFYEIIIDF